MIAETKAGYQNSKVPLRMKLHCIAESEVPDGLTDQDTLNKFSQGDDNAIRKSADAAHAQTAPSLFLLQYWDNIGREPLGSRRDIVIVVEEYFLKKGFAEQ